MSADVRTPDNIMTELLTLVVEGEWSGKKNTACSCHPEYASSCPDCDEFQYPHREFGAPHPPQNEHKSYCTRAKLITEARAYLRVNNKLAEERGEEGVYIP